MPSFKYNYFCSPCHKWFKKHIIDETLLFQEMKKRCPICHKDLRQNPHNKNKKRFKTIIYNNRTLKVRNNG